MYFVSCLVHFILAQSTTPVAIVSYKDVSNPDGTYEHAFEAANGIKIEATGGNNEETGSVKYTAPDGMPIEWTYKADSNGFQPQGPSIPTVPDHIVRALKYIQDHSTKAPS